MFEEKATKSEVFDLVAWLRQKNEWSLKTFGPGQRTEGVVKHIESELQEIRADPTDVVEYMDVVLLAFDGAFRAGHSPEAVVAALVAKQKKNEGRTWPKPGTQDPDGPTQHLAEDEGHPEYKLGEVIEAGWEDSANFLAVQGHVPFEEALATLQQTDDWKYSEIEGFCWGAPVHAWAFWGKSKNPEYDSVLRVYSAQRLGSFPVTVMWLLGMEWCYDDEEET